MKSFNQNEIELEGNRTREKLGKIISWFSMVLLWPLFSCVIAVNSKIEAFQAIRLFGNLEQESTANLIDQMMVSILLNAAVSLPYLICIFLVLFITQYRSKMFFWLWVLTSMLLFLFFVFGAIIGSIVLMILLVKRKEFGKNT